MKWPGFDTYPCKPQNFRARQCCDRLEQLEAKVGVRHPNAAACGSCPLPVPDPPSLQAEGVYVAVVRTNINYSIRNGG